jgi:hypothetical protein
MTMDWDGAIVRYGEALRRIVATMLAMAGAAPPDPRPFTGEGDHAQHGGGGAGRPEGHPGPDEANSARPTLPRHLYRAVLRVLHPAESAARRLIVVAARGLVVPPPRLAAPKPAKRRPSPTGIVYPYGMRPGMRLSGRFARRCPATLPTPAARRPVPARIRLPLCETLRPPSHRPRSVPASSVPRITLPGITLRHALPPKPTPFDAVDATRLGLRIAALAAVLDDLPKEALRFARWRARRDAMLAESAAESSAPAPDPRQRPGHRPGRLPIIPRPRRIIRVSPLRPGRPPGSRRRDRREVHQILADLQQLAWWVLEPDTS